MEAIKNKFMSNGLIKNHFNRFTPTLIITQCISANNNMYSINTSMRKKLLHQSHQFTELKSAHILSMKNICLSIFDLLFSRHKIIFHFILRLTEIIQFMNACIIWGRAFLIIFMSRISSNFFLFGLNNSEFFFLFGNRRNIIFFLLLHE